MTPRKELFIAVKEALVTIPQLELVDFFRGQFSEGSTKPNLWTAALIRINNIVYETMTEHNQESIATVDVILYCIDGWMAQHNRTTDPEHGLIEIDLQDAIVDKLQFLKGEQFKPLQQTEDETEEATQNGIMSYRSTFTTRIYRTIQPKYQKRKITINQD